MMMIMTPKLGLWRMAAHVGKANQPRNDLSFYDALPSFPISHYTVLKNTGQGTVDCSYAVRHSGDLTEIYAQYVVASKHPDALVTRLRLAYIIGTISSAEEFSLSDRRVVAPMCLSQ